VLIPSHFSFFTQKKILWSLKEVLYFWKEKSANAIFFQNLLKCNYKKKQNPQKEIDKENPKNF